MWNTNKESGGPTYRYTPCDWYYDIPLKRSEEQVSSNVAQQPKSRILRLGNFEGPHQDIAFGGRRKWIRDTDSEYVKLAKQGGQPDLLRHFTSPRKVSPYCAPESHHSKQAANNSKSCVAVLPDYMIHKEFNSDQPTRYKPKRGPFDFDTKSFWQRGAEDKEKKKKIQIKLPAILPHRTEQNITSKFQEEKQLYFPRMLAHKKNEPVNFSKLISGSYGNEWLQQRDQWKKKNTLPKDSETSQPTLTQTDIE